MSGRRKAENGGKTRKDAANRGAGKALQEERGKGGTQKTATAAAEGAATSSGEWENRRTRQNNTKSRRISCLSAIRWN